MGGSFGLGNKGRLLKGDLKNGKEAAMENIRGKSIPGRGNGECEALGCE